MYLKKLSFFDRINLKLVSKVLPVKRPETILLDELEIAFKKAKVSQIIIPAISFPDVSQDYCPGYPQSIGIGTVLQYSYIFVCENGECNKNLRLRLHRNQIGIKLKITCPTCEQVSYCQIPESDLTYDFTNWLKEQLFYPEIESFPLAIKPPRRAGKQYGVMDAEDTQLGLFDSERATTQCRHGLTRAFCGICIEKEKKEREPATSHVDLFDLIFPILQPPLGDNFDSPIAFPSGKELYPFQRTGVKFLIENDSVLLGDEMGLGKSIQAIVAIKFLFRMGKVTKGLILCPRSVLIDWEKKLWEWAPEVRVVKVRGSKEHREIIWNSPFHLYLTTYETLREDLSGSLGGNGAEDIAKKEFDFIVLDEIQKIKNPGANVTKATRMIEAEHRWGLSGTPLENRIEDIISVFAYLKPGLLIYEDAKKPQKLKRAIKPFFLRRRKSEALPELPPILEEDVWLELTPAQRDTYERAEQEGIVALNEQGDSVTVQHILALITKLKQICNIDPITQESCKLEYLEEKLEEISEQDEKALVFSQYPEKTLRLLEPELERFNPNIFEGSLSDSQRDRLVEDFQNEERSKVLLMSVKAGGLGLTLTKANNVFHFDHWWNPAVAEQAVGRAHRIGQKNTVFVTSLFTSNTIEERIQNLLERKRSLFREVIDDLSDTKLSAALTEEELFSLFDIKKEREEKQRTARKPLGELTPQEFETLVAELFESMGYAIKTTPQTRDKGIDIHAKRQSEAGLEYLAIECKHYPGRVVGVEYARSLYGVIQAEPSITKGALVTSGEFSRDCRDFVRGKRIELFDGNYLHALLERYGMS